MNWSTLWSREHRFGTILAILVLGIAALYYAWSAMKLPIGAGPDEPHNIYASRFYAEHQRMSSMPADEDLVPWSAYGTSRTMRPPLAFITSAALSKLSGQFPDEPRSYRWSSIAFMLGMLAIAGYCAAWMSGSVLFSAVAMAFVAFWPQVHFTASYHNDDAAALFVAALGVLAMVWIFKRGATVGNTLLTAAIGGLMLISKLNVWIGALPLIGVWLWGIRHDLSLLRKPTLWLGVVALLIACGGWWIINNMLIYGIDDPLQRKAIAMMEGNHGWISNPRSNGFLAREGRDYFDVIGYPAFWAATYYNSIGNLDWLKLLLGPLQYDYYALLLAPLAVYTLYRSFARHYPADVVFESRNFARVCLVWFIIILALYVAFNTWGDIQLQGRYLFPILPAAIVLWSQAMTQWTSRFSADNQRWIASLLVASTLVINLHGLTRYVLPFYKPDEIAIDWGGEVVIDWQNPRWVESMQDFTVQSTDNGWRLEATGPDPQIVFSDKLCRQIGHRTLINVVYDTPADDVMQIFWDNGHGFNEADSAAIGMGAEDRTGYTLVSPKGCRRLRIDPFQINDHLQIIEMTLQGARTRTRW